MSKAIKAVYENGVLKPLERVDLKEHQQVKLILEDVESSAEDILGLAANVFKNLPEKEIREIEAIILDRSRFSRD